MSEIEKRAITIPEEHAGERLDKVLAGVWPEYSRSRLQAWIRNGSITVDGAGVSPRLTVNGGEQVELLYEPVEETGAEPEAIPLDIVHEDEALIVVNKPAGLVVHPGAGNPAGTLQNALLHHAPELRHVPRSGLVHRLDKDTTGLIVVARTEQAHTLLSAAMKDREIGREYCAVVCGVLTAGGEVSAPLGRHPRDRKRMSVRQGGRIAVTHYRVLERYRAHSYLRLRLETGRTHQIRVHMQHIRHAIVGDPVYGQRLALPAGATEELKTALQGFKRQALHARRLTMIHPVSKKPCEWAAPVPPDMQGLLDALSKDSQLNQERV